jgi:DNA-binding CsgD family transcriptional regulator
MYVEPVKQKGMEKAETFYNEAFSIWSNHTKLGDEISLPLELEIYKKIINITHIGDFYYYIFDLKMLDFQFVSPTMSNVLGYSRDEFTVSFFLSCIHPDDLPYFVQFESKVGEFFNTLENEDFFKYKVRYDYRVRKNNGEYIRLLQQVVTLSMSDDGGINKTLGIHTDITHLKPNGIPMLSFIGMDGEPSFVNVAIDKQLMASKEVITKREKDVLNYIIQGYNSTSIANELFLSKHTVLNHRRNILKKTNCTTTAELIAKCVKEGWV